MGNPDAMTDVEKYPTFLFFFISLVATFLSVWISLALFLFLVFARVIVSRPYIWVCYQIALTKILKFLRFRFYLCFAGCAGGYARTGRRHLSGQHTGT